jgi:hypothetical protein
MWTGAGEHGPTFFRVAVISVVGQLRVTKYLDLAGFSTTSENNKYVRIHFLLADCYHLTAVTNTTKCFIRGLLFHGIFLHRYTNKICVHYKSKTNFCFKKSVIKKSKPFLNGT